MRTAGPDGVGRLDDRLVAAGKTKTAKDVIRSGVDREHVDAVLDLDAE